MANEYIIGKTYCPGDAGYDGDVCTYEIDLTDENGAIHHYGAISVHTTQEDRDTIIETLNNKVKKQSAKDKAFDHAKGVII